MTIVTHTVDPMAAVMYRHWPVSFCRRSWNRFGRWDFICGVGGVSPPDRMSRISDIDRRIRRGGL